MILLSDPDDVTQVEDEAIRTLLVQRFDDFCQGEPYDPDLHARVVLVEPGDSAEAIETASGCRIVRELFSERRYGDPGFTPTFDLLEEHDTFFEWVFVENDGAQAVLILIKKQVGIDDTLLQFCRDYAEPAPDLKTD